MDSATRRRIQGSGLFEGLYRVIMRRNSVYVTFVIAGAFLGERAVDYGVHRLWEYNNVGKILTGILSRQSQVCDVGQSGLVKAKPKCCSSCRRL
ncbi:cytochrome b-c1 complex subunit 9-like isoform X1 [Hibiscus syriacus]|uniref:cytochrome b-c1 complex subunit 9-like isoform X1 n=1 Tax=Hibiscus syriacus TaxID=106335 RepID=UPI0019230A90|nr:cytochrome b-c1 complex subunit 9-like isoform X1 [Hibiscus syriacus]